MGLLNMLSPAASRVPASAPKSLLERHLCFCRRTRSVGIDRGLSISIVHSEKPQAGQIDPWPATELEVCKALRWPEERLLRTCIDYIKANYSRAGEADHLLCRIMNECEQRLGRPVSAHPFIDGAEGVLSRESLVKSLTSTDKPEAAISILRDKYGLGDTVIAGRTSDVSGEIRRLLRPVLAGLACHPKFLYFEVDNEPWNARQKTQGISSWLDYTVIHARFASPLKSITFCVFSHSRPQDTEGTYYILATHLPKLVDYLHSHMKKAR